YNPASERIAGASLAPFVGKPLPDIVPYAAGGKVEGLLMQVARERRVSEINVDRSRDPRQPNRALAVKGFPLPGGHVGLAFEDVTTQTIERRLQLAEHKVLEMIARGTPLADSLAALVLAVEEFAPPVTGSVLLLDPDGQRVRHGAAPHLPESFLRAIDGASIGPRAGSCGTAAFLKRAVIVSDIETDPLWEDWRTIALAHGLRSCWSVPILSTDQTVLGTFAFYYNVPRTPGEGDRQIIERAARLAAIAIERKQLEDQLRGLSARIESILEDERTGIAREIHDELGQSLTALKMDIAWLARRIDAPQPTERSAIREKLDAMSNLTDEIIGQVRRISSELRPGVLDDLGLIAAIEWQAQEFEGRTGTECTVRTSGGDAPISRATATAVFRVLQEALTNVTRHAQAQRVDVRLEIGGASLALAVRDDGRGITPEELRSPKSLGLLGIRERAHRLGGSVSVGPASPSGTLVLLTVPIHENGGAA
ncbi:MAG TPA: GAF domain-containing sensor histidine kinase, partial [Polyangiaceae bacterium]|nr:GAF domain-containing sensor histidine kinase [Polyangiaceae bacterium]